MSYKEYASKEYVEEFYLKKENINSIVRDFIVLRDRTTNCLYNVYIKDGILTSSCKIAEIKVNKMPNKTAYIQGEKFDPDGIEVAIILENGNENIIDGFITDDYVINSTVNISYMDEGSGEVITTSIEVEIEEFDPAIHLIDFDYIANDDGTYTLTGWKQTLNGESSTELIIPDNNMIVL